MSTPLTPTQMIAKCGNGINLGLFFEMNGHDCSASTVSPILKAYADKGFKSVRIPVTYFPALLNGACRLDDPVFMQKLDNAVYYSVSLGMTVMLNAHFENWLYDNYDGSAAFNSKFWGLWRRIATRYNNIAQGNLVFETLNEPHANLGNFDRNNQNDPNALLFTRAVNKVAFDGIRSVNKTRIIVLTVNGMQAICQAQQVYPNIASFPMSGTDKYLMVACHSYTPWSDFCGESANNNYYLQQPNPFAAQYNDINNLINQLTSWRNGLNYPSLGVAMTEFGVGDKWNSGRRNTAIVSNYYRMTGQMCRAAGILPMAWNDCSQSSWFGLSTLPSETNGTVQWIYGLANACLGINVALPPSDLRDNIDNA